MIRMERLSHENIVNKIPCTCICHEFRLRKIGSSRYLNGIRVHYIVWRFLSDSWSYEPYNYNVTISNFGNGLLVNYEYMCEHSNNTTNNISNSTTTTTNNSNNNRRLSTSKLKLPCNTNLCHTFKSHTETTEVCAEKTGKKNCEHSRRHILYSKRNFYCFLTRQVWYL